MNSLSINSVLSSHLKPLMSISSNMSVKEACEYLYASGISSAPVFDADLSSFIGHLDYFDLLNFILDFIGINHDKKSTLEKIQTKINRPVSDIQIKNQTTFAKQEDTVEHLLESFKKGAYAICIKEDNELIGAIAKSSLISGVLSRCAEFDKMEESVSALKLIEPIKASISKVDNVKDAFYKMCTNNMTAIPIIEENKLLGSISMSDFKELLFLKEYNHFFMNAYNFFKLIKTRKFENAVFPFIYITPSCKLISAIKQMLASEVHQLWVVDNEILIGQVCIDSVLSFLL
jgi:predicted transcriptional regulator